MARMFNPPHPGRMVAETLEYLGISAREFARHIGVAPSTVTRIIKEKKSDNSGNGCSNFCGHFWTEPRGMACHAGGLRRLAS